MAVAGCFLPVATRKAAFRQAAAALLVDLPRGGGSGVAASPLVSPLPPFPKMLRSEDRRGALPLKPPGRASLAACEAQSGSQS